MYNKHIYWGMVIMVIQYFFSGESIGGLVGYNIRLGKLLATWVYRMYKVYDDIIYFVCLFLIYFLV